MVEVITSGLPQVCNLWLGVNKGMLPVKHLAQKILKIMAVNYCGRQLARRLGLALFAFHEKEGATPHPGVCMFGLQYVRRPDDNFGEQVGMCNFDSLSGNGGRSL